MVIFLSPPGGLGVDLAGADRCWTPGRGLETLRVPRGLVTSAPGPSKRAGSKGGRGRRSSGVLGAMGPQQMGKSWENYGKSLRNGIITDYNWFIS